MPTERRQFSSVGARAAVAVALTVGVSLAGAGGAAAETLETALAQAYKNNPQINAQRAALRSIDESVPQALAGYRPRVSATATGGTSYTDTKTFSAATGRYSNTTASTNPRSVGVTATQTLFNGLQTANRTRQAEAQVFGSSVDGLSCGTIGARPAAAPVLGPPGVKPPPRVPALGLSKPNVPADPVLVPLPRLPASSEAEQPPMAATRNIHRKLTSLLMSRSST